MSVCSILLDTSNITYPLVLNDQPLKGTVSWDIYGTSLAKYNRSRPREEPLMVFRIISSSSNFILIFKILMWLVLKALQQRSLIGYLLQNTLIRLGVYSRNVKILMECRYCLLKSVGSHCKVYWSDFWKLALCTPGFLLNLAGNLETCLEDLWLVRVPEKNLQNYSNKQFLLELFSH